VSVTADGWLARDTMLPDVEVMSSTSASEVAKVASAVRNDALNVLNMADRVM
jgi:hypothetical protein